MLVEKTQLLVFSNNRIAKGVRGELEEEPVHISFPSLQYLPETTSLEDNRLVWLYRLEDPVKDQSMLSVSLSLYLCFPSWQEHMMRGKSLISLLRREKEVKRGATILPPPSWVYLAVTPIKPHLAKLH